MSTAPRTPTAPPPPPPGTESTFGELLGHALRLYRRRPLMFIALAAVTVVPVGAITVLAGLLDDDLSDAPRAAIVAALALIPAVLLLPVSGSATAVAVVRMLKGERATAGRALAPVGARLGTLVVTLLIVTVGVVSGLAVLIAPGVFILVIWLFAGPAVVVERLPVKPALRRSQALVTGAWWTVFLAWLIIQILVAGALLLLGLPARPITDSLSGTAGTVVAGAWSTAANLVVQPFALIAIALLYVDRTVRREGRLPAPAGAADGDAGEAATPR